MSPLSPTIALPTACLNRSRQRGVPLANSTKLIGRKGLWVEGGLGAEVNICLCMCVCMEAGQSWGLFSVFVCLSLSSSQSRNGNTKEGTGRGSYWWKNTCTCRYLLVFQLKLCTYYNYLSLKCDPFESLERFNTPLNKHTAKNKGTGKQTQSDSFTKCFLHSNCDTERIQVDPIPNLYEASTFIIHV